MADLAPAAVRLPFPDLILPPELARTQHGQNTGRVTYAITGSLSRGAAGALYQQTLNDLIVGYRHVTIDLGAAAYLDGHALEQIKRLSQKILEVRGALYFERVNDDLAKLFELTNLSRLFTINAASRERPAEIGELPV